ncbi:MAG TPA: ferritin family protein [Acidobacteriota bacterium]|nr:ferritin family protein [Acidobacteriota bacterium]
MNIFEYAMKMESDGREFYLEHAEKQDIPALRKILLELAEDELKHYNIFKALRDGKPAEYRESEKTRIITTVKNVFESLKAEDREFSFPREAKNVWEQAREIERKSETFYREKADGVDDGTQKGILTSIADEEHEHWVTMENVIRFLDRPNHWLEDAEWSNLEDY